MFALHALAKDSHLAGGVLDLILIFTEPKSMYSNGDYSRESPTARNWLRRALCSGLTCAPSVFISKIMKMELNIVFSGICTLAGGTFSDIKLLI